MTLFKSRKNSAPTVSPLAPPPPASTRPFSPNQPGPHQQQSSQFQMNGQGSGGVHQGQMYQAGHPVDRSMSYESSTMKSDKSEKRRSGFFGFGKKDKDKERDSRSGDREKDLPHPRHSLSQEHRLDTHHLVNPPQSQSPNGFQPHQMQQFPPPQNGQSPPPPQSYHQQQQLANVPQQGQRVVSQPHPLSIGGSDFGPYPNPNQMPKSQTTSGFSQYHEQQQQQQQQQNRNGSNIPDTHPYRGFLNAQQEKEQRQGSLPRSASSPLDKAQPPLPLANGHSNHSTPDTSGQFTAEGSSGASTQQPHVQSELQPRGSPGPAPGSKPQTPRQQQGTPPQQQQGTPPQQQQPAWQREFNTVVDLISAQPSKHYVASPPELEMILARTSAGGQPKQGQPGSASNDWDQVWLQLSGISLSMWSMKETRAAAAKGEKVPPTYFNITDSSLELLAPLPPPPHRPNSHAHHFVFSLNTAGSNRLLFSCPGERDLAKWATGLRLAAWERARLEEMYTGHLVKGGGREPPTELVRGRMEGWVRARVMGGTDWKRLWLVLSVPGGDEQISKEEEKKNRRRSFFGLGEKQPEVVQEPNTGFAMAAFYLEPRTSKNRTIPPVLTINNVTQTYAVFPERLDVMSQSNLMKVVGRVNGELVTIEGRLRDSGWALIMPDAPGDGTAQSTQSPLANMMRWVTGFHDVFQLYGRPERYIWDRQDPKSLFFAYPEGSDRNQLFLDVDEALSSDFRSTSLPDIRTQFVGILKRKISLPAIQYRDEKGASPRIEGDYRLPPLAFDKNSPNVSDHSVPRSLTPISERTDDASRQNSTKTARSQAYERKVSDGGPSKQSSGNSLRHPGPSGSGDDGRLAPITDEGNAPFTDEPESTPQAISPDVMDSAAPIPDVPSGATVVPIPAPGPASVDVPAHPRSQSLARAPTPPPVTTQVDRSISDPKRTDTAQSGTGVTIWSQDTGPSRSDNSTPSTVTTEMSPEATFQPSTYSTGPNVPASSSSHGQSAMHEPSSSLSSAAPAPLPDLPSSSARYVLPAIPSTLGEPLTALSDHSTTTAGPSTRGTSMDAPNIHTPTPRRVASGEFPSATSALHEEPAAMYLMNMVEEPQAPIKEEKPKPVINTNLDGSGSAPVPHHLVTRPAEVTRRPSGARAPPPKKTSATRALVPVDEAKSEQSLQEPAPAIPRSATLTDISQDASAFMEYADTPSPVKPKPAPLPRPDRSPERDELRSSFAPSKAQAERRAKAEADAIQQERAKTLPGAGKRTAAAPETWSGSEDENEDEEEEQESPIVPVRQPAPPQSAPQSAQSASQYLPPQIHQQQHRPPTQAYPSAVSQPPSAIDQNFDINRSMSRARALPPVPGGQIRGGEEYRDYQSPQNDRRDHLSPQYDRPGSQYQSPAIERPRTQSPAAAPQHRQSQYPSHGHHPPQPSAPGPVPPTQRQTVWNANFSAEHGMVEPPKSGKFIEIEEPSVQLTKAFAPHGLLQAGIQDKEDRSAKKQEEVARETGSSLINVPSKPPPPQTGLLGAVAAHERDRKNAGGIGATLTDREREKRLAEERGRELEKMQKAQMEQMRQFGGNGSGGDMYGGQFPYNMGMMGMPPMNYGGYQGGYNPYAQQQAMMAAQMAYQQAMMMSQHGGSQAGGHGGATPDRPASPSSHHQGQPGGQPQAGYGFPPNSMYSGWPGMPPWMGGMGMMGMSSPPPGSPGMGMGMRMSMPPGMGMPGMDGNNWLYPNMTGPAGQNGGGSGPATPYRGQSMYSEGGGEGHGQGQGQGQGSGHPAN